MNTSSNGLSLIKHFESCQLRAYLCPAGFPTIGYGHRDHVKMGDSITQEQAEHYLIEDVHNTENAVNRLLTRAITQCQFDALVSLCFNIGEAYFAQSNVLKLTNAGQFQEAALNFKWWRRVGGSDGDIEPGLVKRRQMEKALYLS